jgi:hypothetical protein
MKKVKFILTIALSVIFLSGFSSQVVASTYGQNNETVEVTSDSKVVYKEVELADTALDMPSLAAVVLTMSSGLGALILKKKIA